MKESNGIESVGKRGGIRNLSGKNLKRSGSSLGKDAGKEGKGSKGSIAHWVQSTLFVPKIEPDSSRSP